MISAQDILESEAIARDEQPPSIAKCMCCQRFYFKRGVATIYIEPQRGVPTHGICTPCNIAYRAKYGLPAPQ